MTSLFNHAQNIDKPDGTSNSIDLERTSLFAGTTAVHIEDTEVIQALNNHEASSTGSLKWSDRLTNRFRVGLSKIL